MGHGHARTGTEGGRVDFRIETLEEIDSTNAEMKRRIAAEASEPGLILIANTQTAGRGRFERVWHSPEGGLWFSLHLSPDVPLERVYLMTGLGAMAVAKTIRDLTSIDAKIRWPNDITIDDRKVCGILAEAVQREGVLHVIFGAGINVEQTEFPVELSDTATSLRLVLGDDRPLDREALCGEIVGRFLGMIEDHLPRHPEILGHWWRELSGVVGRRAAITVDGADRDGMVMDVDLFDGLTMEFDGSTETVRGEHVEHFRLL
jgi:BirA family biotin operon repressor/biotin-[acetyl-CoA-carboxylase] ligase